MKKSLLLTLLMLGAWASYAQVPTTISYQGIAVDGTGAPVPDGNVSVRFVFYNALSAGSIRYQTAPYTVTSYKGMFTAIIGNSVPNASDNPPIPTTIWGESLFVEVTVNGSVQSPRITLSTTPYAFVAESANSMDAADLSGTLAPARIAAGSIDNTKLASDLDASKLTTGTLPAARIGAASIDNTKLAAGSISGGAGGIITDASIITADLADNAVTNPKLADNAVGNAEMADNAIGNAEMADNAVSTAEIAASAVTAAKMGAGSVSGGAGGTITDASITSADLAAGSVSGGVSGTITDASITSADLAAGSVSGGVAGTITDASITSADLAAGSVSGGAAGTITDASITSADLAAGSVSGGAAGTITDASITSADLAAGSVSGGAAGTITDASITSADLAAGSVSGGAAGTITDNSIATADIADDAVTVAKIGTAGAPDASKILTTDGSGNPQWSTAAATSIPTGSGQNNLVSFWTGTNTQSSNANLFWDNANSRLGLGTPSPNRRLSISGTGGVENDVLIESFVSTAAGSGTLRFTKAEGTISTPTPTLANDVLGSIAYADYTGAAYSNASQIQSVAETAFNAAVNGALTFSTTASGTLGEKMRLTSTGFLGIGTTPVSAIHTDKTGSGNYHRFSESGTLRGLIGVSAGGSDLIGADADNDFVVRAESNLLLGAGTTERMRITTAGNVGIGTTTTTNKLDVEGSVAVGAAYAGNSAAGPNGLLVEGRTVVGIAPYSTTPKLHIYNYSGAAGLNEALRLTGGGSSVGDGPLLNFQSAQAGSTATTFQDWIGGAIGSPYPGISYGGDLAFYTNNGSVTSGSIATSTLERMRINYNGNVGIGTSSPGSNRLFVNIPSTDATNNVSVRIDNNYTGTSTKYGIDVNVDGAGSGTKYGISSSVVGLAGDNSTINGYQVSMTPNGIGAAYGVYSNIGSQGTGSRIGFYNIVSYGATNSTNIYGIYNSVGSAGTGDSYGIYNTGEDLNYFSGKIGIGTSSLATIGTYKVYIVGTGFISGGAWTASDVRYKKDFKRLTSSLDKIKQLEGFSYSWKREENPEMELPDGRHYGFKAQEIEKVFPELVSTDGNGYKAMNYSGITPVLLEAIKEQQAEIEELKAQLAQYKNLSGEVAELKKMMSAQLKSQPSGTETASSTVGSEKK